MAQEQRTLTWFFDPGHAWLRVPKDDLNKLSVEGEISPFSYVGEAHAYLEEDCDAGIYIEAAKNAGWQISTEDSQEVRYFPNSEATGGHLALYAYHSTAG